MCCNDTAQTGKTAMDLPTILAAGGLAVPLGGHLGTAVLAAIRFHQPRINPSRFHRVDVPPVTILRPVCGIEAAEQETLRSTFDVRAPTIEIIFCAAREDDAAVPFVQQLIAAHPNHDARLLIGEDGPGVNKKLDNARKGWWAAKHDWVAMADSNVAMTPDYLENLFSAWREDTGLVCAPPTGTEIRGFWGEVEAAILNGFQARWQYAADQINCGFAQGKSMLFNKPLLESLGGISKLDREIAEDAAATKTIAEAGLKIRLATRLIAQPVGERTARQVLKRQARWAQLRRHSFPLLYLTEIFTSLWAPLTSAIILADTFDLSMWALVTAVVALWFGAEVAVAMVAGWPITLRSMAAILVREACGPLIWLAGFRPRPFGWRNPMTHEMKPGSEFGQVATAEAKR
ncbi:MAG: hypothetical protein RL291_1689 [Pseudomonadota bacterium]